MHLDVLDLRHFYYRTRLGRTAQGAIREQVLGIWPDAERQTVAGFGFAVPLLRPYLAKADRVMALMPAPQGVMPWPPGEANTAALVQEILWPVETDSVDRLLVMHGLETSEDPGSLLDECYRALAPGGGRALFIVPNRGGLWSRSDATPFGFGRPYSLGQLEALLKSHGLLPQQHKAALFQPPSSTAFWMKTAGFWETVGRRVSRRLAGGVLIVEVSKQVPAPTKRGLGHAIRKPLTVLDGIAKPAPKPA